MIVRTIFYTGNIEHAKKYTAIACSMFDIFVQKNERYCNKYAVYTGSIDNTASVRFTQNDTIGSIEIYGELNIVSKKKILNITDESIRCAWNIKPLKLTYPWGAVVVTPGMYSYLNGAGHGFFALDSRRLIPRFGQPTYDFEPVLEMDEDFFDTSGWTKSHFLPLASQGGPGQAFNQQWAISSSRMFSAYCMLAYQMFYGNWLYQGKRARCIDNTVPAKLGFFNIGAQQYEGRFFSLGDGNFSFIRKSPTLLIHHSGGDLQDDDNGSYGEINVYEPEYVSGAEMVVVTNTEYGRLACEYAAANIDPVPFAVDALDVSVAITGTTEVGSLVLESHDTTVQHDYDWYYFATVSNGYARITQIEKDGSVTLASLKIIDDLVSDNPYIYTNTFNLTAISGYTIRDLGAWIGITFTPVSISVICRNLIVFTNKNGRPHQELTYNFAVNDGCGFVAANIDSTLHIPSFRNVSEESFIGLYSVELTNCKIVKIVRDSGDDWHTQIIAEFYPLEIEYNGETRMLPVRVYHSPNYKYFVVYGSNGTDGVYEISGDVAAKKGEATGLWPVKIHRGEEYVLMEDKAYGQITGSFNRLIGFFYDRFNWLEMAFEPGTGKIRFEIKNEILGVVESTKFGEYSFYETDPEVSFVSICHCTEDGVSKSDNTGKGTLIVNLLDGPVGFETLCAAIVYQFKAAATPFDSGSTNPKSGSEFYYGGKTYPPYGRKYISSCMCSRMYDEDWNLYPAGVQKSCAHLSNIAGSVAFYDPVICPHSNGAVQQLVFSPTTKVAISHVNTDPWAKRATDIPVSKQLIYAIAHNGLSRVFERITDEPGEIDPLLLHEPEHVTDSIEITEV